MRTWFVMQTKPGVQTRRRNQDEFERLQRVTESYAKFSRSAAGLGNVVGAVAGLIIFFIAGLADLNTASRLLVGLTPIFWIIFKELLKRHYYQRYGRVRERTTRAERAWHLGLTGFIVLISLVVLTIVVTRWSGAPSPSTFGYLAWVVAMPVLTWFYLRSTAEFYVGILLICQAAVILGGGNYALTWWNAYLPILLLIGLVMGLQQHRDYKHLEASLHG